MTDRIDKNISEEKSDHVIKFYAKSDQNSETTVLSREVQQ